MGVVDRRVRQVREGGDVSAYREKPKRDFAFNPNAYEGAVIPMHCYRWDGRVDWPRVFQWICPELTNEEADLCVFHGRMRLMRMGVETVRVLVGELE